MQKEEELCNNDTTDKEAVFPMWILIFTPNPSPLILNLCHALCTEDPASDSDLNN